MSSRTTKADDRLSRWTHSGVTCLRRELRKTVSPTAAGLLAVLVLVGRGGALLPGYSGDDYLWVHLDHLPWRKFAGEGRFGSAILGRLLEYAGAGPPWAWLVYGALLLATSVALGLAVTRFWGERARGTIGLLASALIVCHPFTTEISTYRIGALAHAVSMGLAAAVLAVRPAIRPSMPLAVLLVALALSFDQTSLNLLVMAALCTVAIGASRAAGVVPGRVVAGGIEQRAGRSLLVRAVGLSMAIMVGVALYLAVGFLVTLALGVEYESRVALLGFSDLPERAKVGLNALFYRTLHPGPVLPWGAGILQGALAATTLLLLLRKAIGSRSRRESLLWLATIAALALAALWTLGLMWVLRDFHPSPRVTFHVALLWAALMLVAWRTARSTWLRAGLLASGALLVLSYLGTSNRILLDQQRLNLRDQLRANRILADLEKTPGFDDVKRLAVVGANFEYPSALRTLDGMMNASGLYSWGRTALFVEISGRPFADATPEDEAMAAAACSRRPHWPDAEGVFVDGEVAVVCLERSGGR